ncbi:hypothetical protein [Methanogenium cariaci]|uniref:hypothetical protein n=1 Tax=Methanogenium cariaci TaxID=2197 RepID=UPI001FDEB134|nr:hypothetical protein [Methanogenium cariaci]
MDLLVVGGEESCVRYDAVQAVEEELGFELQVTVIPYYRWEQMLESDDVFARNVFRDHILLGGVFACDEVGRLPEEGGADPEGSGSPGTGYCLPCPGTTFRHLCRKHPCYRGGV